MKPDQEFANPRLAEIYDYLDNDRSDLDHYVNIIESVSASTILDVGCGTGSLLCSLTGKGYTLCGVDPAAASLDVARNKSGSKDVDWVLSDAASLPMIGADIALMTGNVAQIFIRDRDWSAALTSIYDAITSSGYLVFESRDPAKRAWEEWTRVSTLCRTTIPNVGAVVSWVELTNIELPLVSFKWTYEFESDGAVLTSTSTLRFRTKQEVENSLNQNGFNLLEVRDAPDRPGREFVFIARANNQR